MEKQLFFVLGLLFISAAIGVVVWNLALLSTKKRVALFTQIAVGQSFSTRGTGISLPQRDKLYWGIATAIILFILSLYFFQQSLS